MDESTIQSLMQAFRNGDRKAFAQLYEELKIPVYTVICRIVQNRATAEDLMQEVFLKIYNAPPSASIKNMRAWIFRTAHNAAIDELRKKRNSECDLSAICIDLRNNEHWLDTRIDLENALRKLPVEQREILTLRLNADFGFQQIAEITASSLPSVYRQYRKAITTLKNELNGGQTK